MTATAPPRPARPALAHKNIPASIRPMQRWVCWRYEWRDDKWTKVPLSAKTAANAKSNDPATWSSLGDSLMFHLSQPAASDGVGFQLGTVGAPSGIVAFDLDHCIQDGVIEPWAQEIIDELNSYTEISPSGEGIRILAFGSLPPGGRKRGQTETYDSRRFVTITGQHIAGTPTDLQERQEQIDQLHARIFPPAEPLDGQRGRPISCGAPAPRVDVGLDDFVLLDKARQAKDGAEFARLFDHADTNSYGGDDSAADLALCGKLAFWTGGDEARVDRLFRQSALMRDKWDRPARSGETYGAGTVRKALEGKTEFYSPSTPIMFNPGSHRNGHARAVALPPPPPEWPKPPDDDAFYGLAGRIIERIAPHTEADRTALLVNLLVHFGIAAGSYPHVLIGNTKHTAKLFCGIVGPTATGRKGEATGTIRRMFDEAESQRPLAFVGGMSSGEGLIWAVRDPIHKREPIKEKSRVVDYEMVEADPGVSDKRLMVIEPEIARVLNAMGRQGSTLSPVLRDAWDTTTLRIMTKNNPATATDSHIGIIAHVTPDELRAELSELSIANGMANRFAWFLSRRSKVLPDPEPLDGPSYAYCVSAVKGALAQARTIERVTRDDGANAIWRETYGEISSERGQGLKASLCARAPQIILRIALIHALMDGVSRITTNHLVAAMALWDYAERSVEHLFEDATGNPTADTIYRALARGEMTRTEISDLFGRNKKATDIDVALQVLLTVGKVRRETRADTGGRHAEVWSRPT